MVLSDEQMRGYIKRLLLSRMRILCNNGFYGLLLMHMIFAIDETCETAATDGVRIFFGPEFLDGLSDGELDFVLMHEIVHVALQHCLRREERDATRYNIACDIVVNSNILLSNNMDKSSITLAKYGEAMHLAPDGKEGYNYTATQVYDMLEPKGTAAGGGKKDSNSRAKSDAAARNNSAESGKTSGKNNCAESDGPQSGKGDGNGEWDDHSHWGEHGDDAVLADVWAKRFVDACKAISIREASQSRGVIPAFAKRLLEELTAPQTDWRTILNDFVQEEVVDYSFTPPDRRFDGDFFLPDFNVKDEHVENILFMIDTSGSMSDKMVTAAYSEVKGAIDQYDGKLKGWLGFFDAIVVEPKPFETEEEFKVIRPIGGGGTDFGVIFDYVNNNMDEPPVSIIILTDGYAPFPDEARANGIPVLWLINNDRVTPPWGKIARITVA